MAGLKLQSKTLQMLRLDAGRALNGSGGVNVADDRIDLVVVVAELEERSGNRVVDDLDHAAADELLVLDEREVRFDAGGVAIHHEADGAGGREYGGLRVAISVAFAVDESHIPAFAAGINEGFELRHDEGIAAEARFADVVDFGAMHTNDIEKRLAIDVEAGACAALAFDAVGQRSGRRERTGSLQR